MPQDPGLLFADEEKLREKLSRRVIEFAKGDVLDMDGIKQRVIASFLGWIRTASALQLCAQQSAEVDRLSAQPKV
jgi:hypothetical protein